MISNPQPVLIIGTQRSGSNLLRLMLNQLKEIEAPHPPHILQVFSPLLQYYGNLNNDENFKSLINDICKYVAANPVEWIDMDFDQNKILNSCNVRSLIEIFKSLYEIKATIKGAKYWCCKSMANVYFIPEIEQHIKPFYIHLIRDGRDVAASFKQAIVGEKHVYFIAEQWKQEQELAYNAMNEISNERTALLYFEDFITNPEKSLTPILHKLGLKWNDSILKFYESKEAILTAQAGEMWHNVIKPIDSTNKKHFSEKLDSSEIKVFEKVAGATLKEFGYETIYSSTTNSFSESEIESFKLENDNIKKVIKSIHKKDAQVRFPQEMVLTEIKNRLSTNN